MNYLKETANKITADGRKNILIAQIQMVLVNWGEFGIYEVEHHGSPIANSIGDTKQVIEHINNQTVTVTTYVNDIEINEEEIFYSDLSLELLEEILIIAEDYDLEQQKVFDSCKDENF